VLVPLRYIFSEALLVSEPVLVQFIPAILGLNPLSVMAGVDSSCKVLPLLQTVFCAPPEVMLKLVFELFHVAVPGIKSVCPNDI
jgi:hypothetical protein